MFTETSVDNLISHRIILKQRLLELVLTFQSFVVKMLECCFIAPTCSLNSYSASRDN